MQALKHSAMLQEDLDAIRIKLDEQNTNGELNIKSMTQEIVRMTEVSVFEILRQNLL